MILLVVSNFVFLIVGFLLGKGINISEVVKKTEDKIRPKHSSMVEFIPPQTNKQKAAEVAMNNTRKI